MKTFEYNILSFPVTKQKDYDELQRGLNEPGAEGCEVITAEAATTATPLSGSVGLVQ